MLEKQVAALLARHLGLFIRDLNEDQLQISLWSGEVTLQNLVLQPDVLERISEVLLRGTPAAKEGSSVNAQSGDSPLAGTEAAAKKALLLPFTVAKGVIHEMKLHIPWVSLDSEAVRVEVTGVELVFAPLRAKPYAPEEEARRQEVMKEEQLAEYETRRQTTANTDEARKPVVAHAEPSQAPTVVPTSPMSPTSSLPPFLQRLVQAMYRNVRVTARQISVRYVLDYAGLDASLACAFSLWVDEISFSPTSADFSRPVFLPTPGAAADVASRSPSSTPSNPSPSPADVESRAAHVTTLKFAVHAHRLGSSSPATVSQLHEWSDAALASFAQGWQHSETLLSCDTVSLHVKQSSAPASAHTTESGASAHSAKAPVCARVVALTISLGDHLGIDVSFGALMLLRYVSHAITDGFAGVPYRRFLPLLPAAPCSRESARTFARQRWAFALACVAQDVRRSRRLDDYASDCHHQRPQDQRRARLDRIVAFGQLRREYCDLWKRSRSFYWLPPLDASEALRMRELESQASLSQIVLLRAFAYAEMDVEHAQRMQQDAWIAEKKKAGDLQNSGQGQRTTRKSASSGLLRWFGLAELEEQAGADAMVQGTRGAEREGGVASETDLLLQRRRDRSRAYTFRDLSGCTEPLHVSFEAEWALAREFLDARQAAKAPKLFALAHRQRSTPTKTVDSASVGSLPHVDDDSSAANVATPVAFSVRVVVSKVSITVRAECCMHTTAAETSLAEELFLQHINQQFIVQLTGCEYFFISAIEQREDKARMSLYVKSFSAHFGGTLNTPLILSREGTPARDASGGHAHLLQKIDSVSSDEDFIVVKQNATQTRLTVTVASFVVLVRPLHELYWWTHDTLRLLAHLRTESSTLLPAAPRSDVPLVPSSTPDVVRPLSPFVDCSIAPFAVLMPLFAHDLTFSDLASSPPAYLPSSPNSVVGSLNSTAAPDEGSACSYGSFGSVLGAGLNSERLVLQGQPCLILSVPSGIRIATVTGAERRHQGAGQEFYMRVGDESKAVRLSCQTDVSWRCGAATDGSAACSVGRFPRARRVEMFSFTMFEVIVNPEEIGVVLEMGVDATLDPHVFGLINDRLLRPDVFYGCAAQRRASASLWASMTESRSQWRLASAWELILRDGQVAITMNGLHTRHYVALLAQHHAKCHPQWRARTLLSSPSRPPGALPTAPRRRISFMAGLLKLRLYDEVGVELLDVEFVSPQDEDGAPTASAPFRHAFSFFGGAPRAVEILLDTSATAGALVFACVPDISINTAVGASVATVSQLCVTMRHEMTEDGLHKSVHVHPSLRDVRFVMGEECHTVVQVLARVYHTLTFPDVEVALRDVLSAPVLSAVSGATAGVHAESAPSSSLSAARQRPGDVHCLITARSASVYLPLSREVGMSGCALDVSLLNLRASLHIVADASQCLPTTASGSGLYKTHCQVDAVLAEALRVEEDLAADQDSQLFPMLGPLLRTPRPGSKADTSARGACDETLKGATVHACFITPYPVTEASGVIAPPSPPLLHVDVSQGHLCAYMPFIKHLFYTVKDPLYTELVSRWHAAAQLGFLSSRLLVPCTRDGADSRRISGDAGSGAGTGLGEADMGSLNSVERSQEEVCAEDAAAPTTAPLSSGPQTAHLPQLSVTLKEVELYVPTDNGVPVAVADESTFFLLYAEELTITEKRLKDEQGVMRRRLLVESSSLRYHDGNACSLLPLFAHLTVAVEFGVLLVPKQTDTIASNFHYIASKPGDVCVRASIAPSSQQQGSSDPLAGSDTHVGGCQGPVEQTTPGAVSLTLQASRIVALVEMIQRNLGRPLFPPGVIPTRRPGASTIMITTAPLTVVVTDHAMNPAFKAVLKDGFQYYKAGGGQWERCPSQRVFISGIQLDAVSSAPARLLWSRAARLITEVNVDVTRLRKSLSTVVEVDSAEVSLDAPRAWLAFHDLLVHPCVATLADAASPGRLSRQASTTSLSSRSTTFGAADRRELVTVDLRVGVRNTAVRAGDAFTVPQIVLGVPECLVSLHIPARGVTDVNLTLGVTTTSPPTLQIYYTQTSDAHGRGGQSSVPLQCVDLLAWDRPARVDELTRARHATASSVSSATTPASTGIEFMWEMPQTNSAASPPIGMPSEPVVLLQSPRITVTVRGLRVVPHFDGYAACVRLFRCRWPVVEALLAERAQLRQAFAEGVSDPDAGPDCARSPPAAFRAVLDRVTILLPSAYQRGDCADSGVVKQAGQEPARCGCWLEVGRIDVVPCLDASAASPCPITAHVEGVHICVTNYYPVVLPSMTYRMTRVSTARGVDGTVRGGTHLAVSVTVHGRLNPPSTALPSEEEAAEEAVVLFSMPHAIALASCCAQMLQHPSALRELDIDSTACETTTPSVSDGSSLLSWAVDVVVERLNVALTSSEYTSGDHQLRLTCSDPVTLHATCNANSEETRVQATLTVHGRCCLSTGDGETLAHRNRKSSDARSEQDDPLRRPTQTFSRGDADETHPTVVLSTYAAPPHEAAAAIHVATTGVRVCANHNTLAYARRLSKVLRADLEHLLRVVAAAAAPSARPSVSPPSGSEEVASPAGLMRVHLLVNSVAAEVGHCALVEIRDVRLEPSELNRMHNVLGSDRAAAEKVLQPADVAAENATLTVGSVVLLSQETGLVHASLQRPSVSVSRDGRLHVMLPHVLIRTDGSAFFVDVLHSVLVWQAFLRAETLRRPPTSQPTADGAGPWLRGVTVSLRDTHIQCHPSRSSLSRAFLELQVSTVDVRHHQNPQQDRAGAQTTATAPQWVTSVEANGCLMVLNDEAPIAPPGGTLPPIVHRLDLALKVEPGRDAVSGIAQTQVTVRSSPVVVHLPMGDDLERCTEALAKALVPLLRYAQSDAAYRAALNRLPVADAVRLTISRDAQGRIVSAVPHETTLVPLSSTIPVSPPAHENGHAAPSAHADPNAPAPTSDDRACFRFTLYVPLLTVGVFDSPDHRRAGHMLAGLELREISAERSRGTQSSVLLVEVGRIASRAQAESLFAFRTGGHQASCPVALRWRDEMLRFASPGQMDTAVEKHIHTVTVSDAEIAVSPAFLIVMNERCVSPLVIGLSRALMHGEEDGTDAVDAYGSRVASHQVAYQDYHDPLDVESDLLLQRDLILGGSSGIQLRFCKPMAFAARNTLTVRSVNHARLILLPMPVTGAPPILVEEGLTVVVESTPVVLMPHSASSFAASTGHPVNTSLGVALSTYVRLGARSVFLVPDAALVKREGPRSSPFSSAPWLGRRDTTDNTAHGRVDRCKKLHKTHDLRVSVGVDARLQTRTAFVQLRVQVVGAYNRETLTSYCDALTAVPLQRPLVKLVAEKGDFETTHLWFACSDGPVTQARDAVTVCVRREKERTTAHVVITPLHFTLSGNHLRLLYAAVSQISHGQCRLRGAGFFSATGHAAFAKDRNEGRRTGDEVLTPSSALGGTVVLGDGTNQMSSAAEPPEERERTEAAGETALLPVEGTSTDEDAVHALTTTVDVRVTAPQVALVVGDDFFTPLVSVSLEALSFACTGDRALQAVAGVGAFTLQVQDFPWFRRRRPHGGVGQRSLFSISPEIALQVDRFEGGGVSASLSVDCGDVEATVPLTRVASLLHYDWDISQAVQPLRFHNQLGVPVLVFAANATPENSQEPPAFMYVAHDTAEPLTALLRHGQVALRLVHEPQPPDGTNLFRRLSYLYTRGTEVDLRQLSNDRTCRFPLEGTSLGVSTGLLDVVLRFNPLERVVQATSSVMVINELQGRAVQWHTTDVSLATVTASGTQTLPKQSQGCDAASSSSPLCLTPGEAVPVPLPLLQMPIGITIDNGRFAHQPSSSALPLESVLSAWTLCPPRSLRCAPALTVPLWFKHQDNIQQLGVQLVFEKHIANQGSELPDSTAGGLVKYELCGRLRPYGAVVNLTGVKVTLELLGPYTSGPAASETDTRLVPETRDVPVQSRVLEHGAQFDWCPASQAEAACPPHFLLKLHVPASLSSRPDAEGTVVTASAPSVTLEAACTCPLLDTAAEAERLLPLVLPKLGMRGSVAPAAVRVRRLPCGTVQLAPLAVVENMLDVPVHIRFQSAAGASSALLGGTVAQVFPHEHVPILWPTHKNKERDDPVKVYIGVGALDSGVSDPVIVRGAVSPLATTLSSAEANGRGLHIFSAAVSSSVAAHDCDDPCTPVLCISPLWLVRNEHPSMTLRVGPTVGDNVTAQPDTSPALMEVEPLSEQPLTYFRGSASSRFVEPRAAFQFALASAATDAALSYTFAWSRAIFLGEVATAASYVMLRHDLVPVNRAAKASDPPPPSSPLFAAFQERAVPALYGDVLSDAYLGCLSVSTKVSTGNQCTFHVRLAQGAEPAPVLVENRTGYTIQCGQPLPSSATAGSAFNDGRTVCIADGKSDKVQDIVVAAFTDSAMCWHEPFLGAPWLRLTAYGNGTSAQLRARHSTTQDLRRLASANEPVALGDSPLFVYVSQHKRDTRCFVVTIMDTRKLASQLLFFPRAVAHMELVVKSLSLFLAAPCVRGDQLELASTPLGVAATGGVLWDVPAVETRAAGGEQLPSDTPLGGKGDGDALALERLKHCELDVVLLRLVCLGVSTIVNEKYLLMGVGVGGIALHDCTSPSPKFPVVLAVDPLPTAADAGPTLGGEAGPPALAFMSSLHFQWPSFTYANRHDGVASGAAHSGRAAAALPVSATATTLPIEEVTAAVGTVTVQLDDRFLTVCRDASACVLSATTRSGTQSASAKSGGDAEVLWSSVSRLPSRRTDSGDDETEISSDEVSIDATTRQLLATQRTLHLREVRDAPQIDCYVCFLHISTVHVDLSLVMSSDGDETWRPFGSLTLFGLEIPSVDRAPLQLRELALRDLVRRGDSVAALLLGVLSTAYRGQVFAQVCRVVGSLAILGNPLALVEGWSRGVRMLVDDAVVRGQPLVGTRAFLKQATSSTLHSVGLISSAGSRALLTLFPSQGRPSGRHRASSSTDMPQPAGVPPRRSSRFLRQLAVGMSGVVVEPIRGARQSGVPGFLLGVTTGLMGAVTRPIAGALSDVSGAAESFSQQLHRGSAAGSHDVNPDTSPRASVVSGQATTAVVDYQALDRNFTSRTFPRGSTGEENLDHCNARGAVSVRATDLSPPQATHGVYRFVSPGTYQLAMNEASQKGLFERDGARYVIGHVGPHNYAVYATYKAFRLHTTPEEFSSWVAIALSAHLARELPRLLAVHSRETKAPAPLAPTPSLDRARNIKQTLGIPALLKHASLEEVVQVCTLAELRSNVAPIDLQTKCGALLARHAVAELTAFLNGVH